MVHKWQSHGPNTHGQGKPPTVLRRRTLRAMTTPLSLAASAEGEPSDKTNSPWAVGTPEDGLDDSEVCYRLWSWIYS